MKVLLFGGSGMVGRELVHALAGHQVITSTHAEVDISSQAAVERVVAQEKPGLVINAAALIDVAAIERDPTDAARINMHGAAAVAHAAARHNVPQLLVSSSYVFGDSPEPYAEDAPKSPANAYGRTKAEAEDTVMASGTSAPWYVVRSSWLYSVGRGTFVDEVAQTLLSGKAFEASVQRGNPTHCGEFAAAVVKNFVDSSPQSGVYHIVNEGSASRLEIAREIARILGVPEELVVAKEFPSSAMRPSVVLLNTKLQKKLPPWQESLSAYIKRIHRR